MGQISRKRGLFPGAGVWGGDKGPLVLVSVTAGGYSFYVIEKPPRQLFFVPSCGGHSE